MNLCNYGCGQLSNYKFKNGKYCCSDNISKCPNIIESIRKLRIGKKHTVESKKKQSEARKGKKDSIETRNKKSEARKGIKNPIYGKHRSDETKLKISNAKKGKSSYNKYTIEYIKNKYPFFSKIEEMRYNPNKPKEKEIQVRCKNHNCPNSKEKDGWFTPTSEQIYYRKNCLENEGKDYSYFYCSDECKVQCPLYRLNPTFELNDLNNFELSYTPTEYQQFREHVLERDKYICQYCGEKAEHVHHERPQKLEPFYALDPDLAWSCCSKCHYEKGHQDECSTSNIANKICN